MSEPDPAIGRHPDSGTIRSPVMHRVSHPADELRVDGTSRTKACYANDSAHSSNTSGSPHIRRLALHARVNRVAWLDAVP